MTERVLATIVRYRMFERGQPVGVAVSGGADSVALLHVLLELAPQLELQLYIPVRIEARNIAALAEQTGDNLEQAARLARREFFVRAIADGTESGVIALGHTRSDQAETVLFRFLRGSGTAGLAGIRPVTPEGLIRPLIEMDRADIVAYLQER